LKEFHESKKVTKELKCLVRNSEHPSSVWDKIWEDSDFHSTEKKIENALKKREAARTLYPPLEIMERLNLKYKNILDIGCGSGSFSLALKKAGKISNAYLIDYSLPALHLAKSVYEYFDEECELIRGDARNLPFNDDSFHLSFSTGLLEHFDASSQETIVKEHCRVAKDIICQVPVSSVPYRIMRFFVTIFNLKWSFGNEKPLHINELEQLFSKANYVIKESSYHDLLTSALFVLSLKTKLIKPLEMKTFLNRLLAHEIAVYGYAVENKEPKVSI